MAKKKTRAKSTNIAKSNGRGLRSLQSVASNQRTYTVVDYRLERPSFALKQVRAAGHVHYEVTGDLSAPVPPLRESKYLDKKQCIEIYRWMLLNRRMEAALENLYKRSEEHTSELQSRGHLVCRLLLEKKKKTKQRQ